MEKKRSNKKWCISLSLAAICTAALLLLLLSPKFHFARTWAADVLYAGAEPEITVDAGHGPVARPDAQAPDDLSVRLHPERHIRRAAQTIELEWKVTKGWRWPDGVGKEVYLINGEFPGPTVEVRAGDELLVTVENQLAGEGVWIHWHGVRLENDAGGVLGSTRCAIAANESYTYRLRLPADVHGTFWYYSEVGTQRVDGLFGSVVVHEPLDEHDGGPGARLERDFQEEQLLMINDWYHKPAVEIMASYQNGEYFDAAPAPDSILLNGRGYFDCSKAYDDPSVDCEPIVVSHLTLPDRAKMRIVNAGSLVGFTISIVGYAMTLLAVDGSHSVEPGTTGKVGILYPGQRMDMLFERISDGQGDSAWITIALDRESMQYPNLALTDTQQFHIATSLVAVKDALERGGPQAGKEMTDVPFLNLSNARGTGRSTVSLERKADRVIALSMSTSHEGESLGLLNDSSWTPVSWPRHTRTEGEKSSPPLVAQVADGALVDVIIDNLDSIGHVLHLQGHDLYIMDAAKGNWLDADTSSSEDRSSTEVPAPLLRDTVFVSGNSHAVLRLRADRGGLWLLRSTVPFYEAIGMNMIIQVKTKDDMALDLGAEPPLICDG